MRIIPLECYKFGELDEDARQLAIEETISFVLELYTYEEQSDNIQNAIDQAEKMRTPWFVNSYVWDFAQDEIMDLCHQFEYTKNGKPFPFHLTK